MTWHDRSWHRKVQHGTLAWHGVMWQVVVWHITSRHSTLPYARASLIMPTTALMSPIHRFLIMTCQHHCRCWHQSLACSNTPSTSVRGPPSCSAQLVMSVTLAVQGKTPCGVEGGRSRHARQARQAPSVSGALHKPQQAMPRRPRFGAVHVDNVHVTMHAGNSGGVAAGCHGAS